MEIKEPFNNLKYKIRKIGNIQDIVEDSYTISSILAYNGDRHLFYAFIDNVNEAIKNKKITASELAYLRSGKIMDLIINLKDTISKFSDRKVFPGEILDKINYIASFQDTQIVSACYTHPQIIDALCKKKNNDLTFFATSGIFETLNPIVQMNIIKEVVKRKKIDVATELLERTTKDYSSYKGPAINKVKKR